MFKELGDYEDSDSRYKETYYQYGLQLLSSKSYKEAVTVFNALGSYQESKTKLNEAKYSYVLAHKNNTDSTTYSYLKDLKSIGYSDARSIYTDLYKWVLNVTAINTSESSSTNMSSISKYRPIYIHYSLSGGVPGGSTKLTLRYTLPSGEGGSYDFDKSTYSRGSSGTVFWEDGIYQNPAYGSTGTLKLRFYDGDGNLICETSVKITS